MLLLSLFADTSKIKESQNMDDISDEGILEIIRKTYKEFSPMFKFLLEISDEYYSKGE